MDSNNFIDVLTNRIAALEQELTAFVEDANRQIVAQQGAITALQQLRDELTPPADAPNEPREEAIEDATEA